MVRWKHGPQSGCKEEIIWAPLLCFFPGGELGSSPFLTSSGDPWRRPQPKPHSHLRSSSTGFQLGWKVFHQAASMQQTKRLKVDLCTVNTESFLSTDSPDSLSQSQLENTNKQYDLYFPGEQSQCFQAVCAAEQGSSSPRVNHWLYMKWTWSDYLSQQSFILEISSSNLDTKYQGMKTELEE